MKNNKSTKSMAKADSKLKGINAVKHEDGWNNVLTGLGVLNRDKNASADISWEILDQETLAELYASDATAGKVIDDLPHEMMRMGFDVKSKKNKKLDELMRKYLEKLDAYRKIEKTMKWARLYGGAVLLMGIDDGQDASKAVNWKNVKAVKWLTVLHRHQINVAAYQEDINLPGYLEPELYQIPRRNAAITSGVKMKEDQPEQYIHASRTIRFDGVELPDELTRQNSGWADSVLTRMWNAIRNYNIVHDSTATVVQGFSQAVLKMKNLIDLLGAGKDDIVKRRLALVSTTSSVLNTIVIQEGEEYERQAISMGGLPEVLNMIAQRMVAATNMPHTKILGESPSGLGATGESEQDTWYDHVCDQQENYLKPRLIPFLEAIYQAKDGPTKGLIPVDADIEFRSLYQMSDKDQADIRLKMAQADVAYVQAGIVDPSEIATSRFGGENYSIETKLDEDVRQAMEDLKPEVPNPQLEHLNAGIESPNGETQVVNSGNNAPVPQPRMAPGGAQVN